jgi:hypothetical protein
MDSDRKGIQEMLHELGFKTTSTNVEYIFAKHLNDPSDMPFRNLILRNAGNLPDRDNKEYEKPSSATTFSMFIHKRDEKTLVRALTLTKENEGISHKVGVSSHYVNFERQPDHPRTNNSSPDSIWYKITVSRPFLIFKIGELYNSFRS